MIWPVARFDWTLDPFRDLHALQRDANRLFADFMLPAVEFPAINLWSSDDEVVLAAELPGVEPKDVDVAVTGNMLTLEGERRADAAATAHACHRNERGTGNFLRSVRLPFEVETDHVQARFDRGVLRVTLPRKESTKPRRIAIATE